MNSGIMSTDVLFQTKFLDVKHDDSPMHPSFSHDDMNKMFESPRKFSLVDLISNSEVVEAASVDRKPSKPSLSEYYHVDESDYSSMYSRGTDVKEICLCMLIILIRPVVILVSDTYQPLRSMSSVLHYHF